MDAVSAASPVWKQDRAAHPRWLRPALALIAALLILMTIDRFGLSWELPAYLYFAVVAVVLSFIDLRYQLLPNAIVLPSLLIAAVLLTPAALLEAGPDGGQVLLRAALGSGALFLLYLIMALISPAGLGMGDVKLAALLGLYLGYLGWDTLLLGAFAGFLLGALIGVAVLVTGRGGRKTTVPFGPSMMGGALLAVGWADPLLNAALPAFF